MRRYLHTLTICLMTKHCHIVVLSLYAAQELGSEKSAQLVKALSWFVAGVVTRCREVQISQPDLLRLLGQQSRYGCMGAASYVDQLYLTSAFVHFDSNNLRQTLLFQGISLVWAMIHLY